MEISKVLQAQDWQYFAKGNANILFKYIGPNDFLKKKLLRIRLAKEETEYILTCELYDFIELKCKPLFPHEIIDIQLVVLDLDFIKNLNSNGHKLMISERYGLVLPNMLYGKFQKLDLSKYVQMYIDYGTQEEDLESPKLDNLVTDHVDIGVEKHNTPSVILEIKPKWLYDNSKNYCRTCSLNQHRNQERHFCPLDLLYEDTIEEGLKDFFNNVPKDVMKELEGQFPLAELFKAYLLDCNNVFRKLKQYQRINHKNDLIRNLNSVDDVLQTLLLVMTLRDVGIFLRFEKFYAEKDNRRLVKRVINLDGEKYVVTCNIYDLDLKLRLKYKHWCDVEEKLMDIYELVNENWRFCVRRNLTGDLEQ